VCACVCGFCVSVCVVFVRACVCVRANVVSCECVVAKLREAQEVGLLFHAADSSLEDSRLSGDTSQSLDQVAECLRRMEELAALQADRIALKQSLEAHDAQTKIQTAKRKERRMQQVVGLLQYRTVSAAFDAWQAAAIEMKMEVPALDEIFGLLKSDLKTMAEMLREPDAASAHSLAAGSRCTAASCENDTARLTLGMIMSGLTIDSILPAGPASECSTLDSGDSLLKVDGIDVDADNFQQLLCGCDQPGSLVTLTIMKGEPSAVHVDSLHSLMPVLAPWSY
jgi:hypothetical protein